MSSLKGLVKAPVSALVDAMGTVSSAFSFADKVISEEMLKWEEGQSYRLADYITEKEMDDLLRQDKLKRISDKYGVEFNEVENNVQEKVKRITERLNKNK